MALVFLFFKSIPYPRFRLTSSILNLINNILIDLLATMTRLDNDKRRERIKQGLERSGIYQQAKKQT